MGGMPRFVLLYHDCPASFARASHWDFMLESGDVLRTWALEQLPCDWETARTRTLGVFANCPDLASGNAVRAEQLADHRPAYLTLEGPLSDGRGSVIRVAAGTYESMAESADERSLKLTGEELSASVILSRDGAAASGWTLRSS